VWSKVRKGDQDPLNMKTTLTWFLPGSGLLSLRVLASRFFFCLEFSFLLSLSFEPLVAYRLLSWGSKTSWNCLLFHHYTIKFEGQLAQSQKLLQGKLLYHEPVPQFPHTGRLKFKWKNWTEDRWWGAFWLTKNCLFIIGSGGGSGKSGPARWQLWWRTVSSFFEDLNWKRIVPKE